MADKPMDIRERTFQFGLEIIRSIEKIPHTRAGNAIANQLIRSATSIGANAQEALAASSKADFIYKTNIALREARETQYWIRLLKESKLIVHKETEALFQESDEITKILGAIVSTARGKRKIR
jgi:four helix bundle protein